MHIAIACGGTGGHAFPGIMTAHVLRRRGHAVTLWLAGREPETAVVKGWDGPVVRLSARGFEERWTTSGFGVAVGHVGASVRALARMRQDRPDVLLGMGSYSSVPPARAARLLGIPVVLHEANAIPGRAVWFLARFADAVGVAFESAGYHFPRGRAVRTGLPMRPPGKARFAEGELILGCPTILVMGGSQGAHALNVTVPAAIAALARSGYQVQVIHLSGKRDEEAVRAAYAEAKVPAKVYGFLEEMDKAYHAATVAICRSGAGSCMELAHYGIPSILVPLPTARRNHQWLNAKELQQRGGAILLDQRTLTVARLQVELGALLDSAERRAHMQQGLAGFAHPDGAERLADLVESVVQGGRVGARAAVG